MHHFDGIVLVQVRAMFQVDSFSKSKSNKHVHDAVFCSGEKRCPFLEHDLTLTYYLYSYVRGLVLSAPSVYDKKYKQKQK